jgi:hypothetical protein
MNLPRMTIRRGAVATLSVLLAASALAAMAPSQALDPAGVGPRDASRAGFPAYYTDDSGVALQLCIDGTSRCGQATLKSDGAGGPGVGVGPDGEGFYWMATATLTGPDMTLDIEFAAEAAWASKTAPITFDRARIRGHSDTAGPIVVRTPYGPFTVNAGDPIEDRNVNFTQDVGCGANCNFRDMTTKAKAHISSWITANTPPKGYLGNAVTPQPANVAGAAATISVAGQDSTNRWVVMGKLAPRNRVSLPNALTFGNVRQARTRSVTMTNLGTTSRTIRKVTLTGSKAFTKLASSTCRSGKVLPVGGKCFVAVRYRPGALRSAAATLNITDSVTTNHVKVRGS